MLDIKDFIAERGGNPDKIRESQRRRGEPPELVDQIIEKYQEHRKSMIRAMQICSAAQVLTRLSPI